MTKKLTTEGIAHEHGKGFELPQGKYLMVVIATAIILVAIGYFATAIQTPTQTSQPLPTPIPTAMPTPVVTGTATPRPTPSATEGTATPTGQEKTRPIDDKWYSVDEKEYRKGEKFQYNGMEIIIKVSPFIIGSTDIMPSEKDNKKLMDAGQEMVVKIKFRIKETGKIFESPIWHYSGFGMNDPIENWRVITKNINLQPSAVEWQPEFGLKNKYNN